MQKKYQVLDSPLGEVVVEFVRKHLRFSTMEEERL